MKILYNANIITVDENMPSANAVAIDNSKIIAVGTDEVVLEKYSRANEKVDMQGKTILPGFIDGHSHITMATLFPKFPSPPVGDIDSVEKLVSSVKAEIAKNPPKKGKWFVGMGYDNATFKDSKHPTCLDLDEISTTVPILLLHVSSHVCVLNSLALKEVGVNKDTKVPDGGKIGYFENGEPNGLLEEKAMMKILGKKPLSILPSIKDLLNVPVKGQELYASFGITTAQDGASFTAANILYAYLGFRKKMLIDVYSYMMIDGNEKALKKVDSEKVLYKNNYRVAGAKLLLDGSPQAKTAWLTKPYHVSPKADDENYCGFPTYSDNNEVKEYFKKCLINNWQILVHCNGDAAGDQYITQYENAMKETGIKTDLRPVMIHAQTIREDQLDKCKELNIYPSFFHDHTFYWGDYHMSSVLGQERGRRISPLKEALDKGIKFTLHQDTPVTLPNMIKSIHNAVNRKTATGQSIGEEFAISPYEAIKAVTINGAFQCHEEDIKGSITVGKMADLVILDNDPLTVSKDEIVNIKVLETIKSGKTIYRI